MTTQPPIAQVSPLVCQCSRGDLVIDLVSRRVTLGGTELCLTETEFRLLAGLTLHTGAALSYDDLLARVWGSEELSDRACLHVHVRNLRQKIETDPHQPQHIINIRRYGYRFAPLQQTDAPDGTGYEI